MNKIFGSILFVIALPTLSFAQGVKVNAPSTSLEADSTTSGEGNSSLVAYGTGAAKLLTAGAFRLGVDSTGAPYIAVTTVAATGSVQGDAAALATGISLVTAADATKGVILPATPTVGAVFIISNTANAVLKVYPGTGDTISGLSANAIFSMAAYTQAICLAASTSAWWCFETNVAA